VLVKLPVVIESDCDSEVTVWVASHREMIEEELCSSGAILLRGFNISTESDFKDAVAVLCGEPLSYSYRSTPRTDVAPGIYTATEYPAGLSIPLHNENAYQRDWPLLLFFFCVYPAERGGQTPLADTLKVTNRIDAGVRETFLRKQVKYIRNYSSGIDLPWQTVFQTESVAEVEEYCRSHDITCEWTPDGALRTTQVCHAFAEDPRTGANVWFNQAHLFHPSSLDLRTREALLARFDEKDLPRNATYGDGSPIEAEALANIKQAFDRETVTFDWEAGDLLILNNMRVSHGRTPFSGKRRVLTAMGQSFSSFGVAGANVTT
jgi:alpha-ketoglutarate-dependent taurine dioxygenase